MNFKLVIFDWAGTLVDHGCRAPTEAFLQAFDAEGLPITEAAARGPIGAHKLDHVKEILAQPALAARLPAHLAELPAVMRADRLYRSISQGTCLCTPDGAAGHGRALRWPSPTP